MMVMIKAAFEDICPSHQYLPLTLSILWYETMMQSGFRMRRKNYRWTTFNWIQTRDLRITSRVP